MPARVAITQDQKLNFEEYYTKQASKDIKESQNTEIFTVQNASSGSTMNMYT